VSPSSTMWTGPRPTFIHAKCHLDPSSRLHNRYGPKIGGTDPGSASFLGRGCKSAWVPIRVRTIVTIGLSLRPIVALSDDYRAR